MTNINQPKNNGNHHNHAHDSQDNCDGCEQQRRENNMLVNFYQRLTKLESKVGKMKDNVETQQAQAVDYRIKMIEMNRLLMNKPEETLKQIKLHDSKEMGYELASALIERQIKAKMENQRLQGIIEQLQKDKVRLQEQKKNQYLNDSKRLNHSFHVQQTQKQLLKSNSTQSPFSDVIDEVRKTNDSSYFLSQKKDKDMKDSYFHPQSNKKYWEDGSIEQEQTNFSSFISEAGKQKKKKGDKQQYEGLNLWLYQFKTQEFDKSPIKSLNKSSNLTKDTIKRRNKF